jgi:hypothetical protein
VAAVALVRGSGSDFVAEEFARAGRADHWSPWVERWSGRSRRIWRCTTVRPGRLWRPKVSGMMRETVREQPEDPVIEPAGPVRDFAVTLSDGRRIIGRDRDGEWSIYVYAPDSDGRLLAFERAATRLQALAQAGLCSDDAGEVLGRAGI